MAFEVPGFSFSLVAAVDLSGSQFRAVTTNASGQARNPDAGGAIVGIRQNKPKANEGVTVMNSGISQVEAGAAIPFVDGGTPVEVDATGRVIPRATGVGVGLALESASAAGVFIAVLLTPRAAA